MTEREAHDRAQAIWGESALVTHASTKGGFAVAVNNVWHQLDADGRPTCHSKCEDLATDVDHDNDVAYRGRLEQLLKEAVGILEGDERLDVREWLKSARKALERA